MRIEKKLTDAMTLNITRKAYRIALNSKQLDWDGATGVAEASEAGIAAGIDLRYCVLAVTSAKTGTELIFSFSHQDFSGDDLGGTWFKNGDISILIIND